MPHAGHDQELGVEAGHASLTELSHVEHFDSYLTTPPVGPMNLH